MYIRVSDEAVTEFQALYKKGTGKDVTRQEAWDMAQRLLTFFDIMTRPPMDELPPLDKAAPDPNSLTVKAQRARRELRSTIQHYQDAGIELIPDDLFLNPQRTRYKAARTFVLP